MLDEENMTDLIRAVEDWSRLNEVMGGLTGGYGLSDSEFPGLSNLLNVLARNSRYAEMTPEEEDIFLAIVHSDRLSAKEKYDLLRKES